MNRIFSRLFVSSSFIIRRIPTFSHSNKQINQNVISRISVTKTEFTRKFTTTKDPLKKKMNEISDAYAEAKLLLKDAMDSKNTIYFSDDLADAEEAVQKVVSDYNQLIQSLKDDKAKLSEVQQLIGLKIEEIKAQIKSLIDSLKEED